MLALGEERLAEAIRTIGLYRGKARNLIATCRALVERHGGEVPRTREALEALPGVGRKTANVVLNVAFGEPTIAVDTHIFRVANRTGLAPGKTPLEVEQRAAEARARRLPAARAPLAAAARALRLPGEEAAVLRLPRRRLVRLPAEDAAPLRRAGRAAGGGARVHDAVPGEGRPRADAYNPPLPPPTLYSMATLEELAERVERLLLRHEELKRTARPARAALAAVTAERDSLRSRLNAARSRIDALLERLPAEPTTRGADGSRPMKQIEVTILGQGYRSAAPTAARRRCWRRSPRSTAR